MVKRKTEIEPDEIFLDSSNLPQFDKHQLEGRIEKPIDRGAIVVVGIFFLISFIGLSIRAGTLQIAKGEEYKKRSEQNILHVLPIFPERGIIYDRNNQELAWNIKSDTEISEFYKREYIHKPGFTHILGYVSYPQKDQSGFFWRNEYSGIDGIEKQYNDILRGTLGQEIIETDALGKPIQTHVVKPPIQGSSIRLSIDGRIQQAMYGYIKDLADSAGFHGGAGGIIDIKTGEVIALVSYPEFDVNALLSGSNESEDNASKKNNPFLNRMISGLYTPGSVVKPFHALGVLNEKIIDPSKKILSTGSISIVNPYDKTKKSVFKDWKAHGWVDLREAIAVSSDVYFYEVIGGFEEQKGLGIDNLKKYDLMFGLTKKTGIDLPGETDGVFPDPTWKEKKFDGDPWRIGDTYNTSIGQYGFLVTPLQMLHGVAIIANKGHGITPRLYLASGDDGITESSIEAPVPTEKTIPIPDEYFTIVHEGMRKTVNDPVIGTARSLAFPEVAIAAKTGTAELGTDKTTAGNVNSWIEGFYPYDNPHYAFVITMEKGTRGNTFGATSAMKKLFEWMIINTPEYLK